MISQFEMNSSRQEINKILNSAYTNEIKKEKVGKHLFYILKRFGAQKANVLVQEFELSSLGIEFICPLLEKK